jgi:fused signal recognition particle receptor
MASDPKQKAGRKAGRFSLLERIIAGPLPRPGETPGQPADSPAPPGGDPTAQARLEKAAEQLDRESAARAAERREQEHRQRLAQTRQSAEEVRQALQAREAELRSRQPELKRELAPGPEADEAAPSPATLAERLRAGVAKTREKLGGGLGRILLGKKELDRGVLEELEEVLLTADVGPQTTRRLIHAVEDKLRRNELKDPERLRTVLREEIERVMARMYPPPNLEGPPPQVILFAGVNGSGKTTTIGKLGAQARRQGQRVLLAAGDTFRAAAAEQLAGWGVRAGCEVFAREPGANPSGVIYQALEQAVRERYDLVLCDTAGRLHTKANLMEELKKIKRVMAKVVPAAPQETWLVLDANNGQNAIHQARDFHQALGVTGLILTKLDGTARGGVLIGIVNEFELPVRYIAVGEGVADLRPFDARAFTASLFD